MMDFYSKLGCFEVAKMEGFPKDVIIMGRSLWKKKKILRHEERATDSHRGLDVFATFLRQTGRSAVIL